MRSAVTAVIMTVAAAFSHSLPFRPEARLSLRLRVIPATSTLPSRRPARFTLLPDRCSTVLSTLTKPLRHHPISQRLGRPVAMV